MQTFDNLKEHYENNMNIDSKNTRKKTATFVRLTRCFCQVIKKKKSGRCVLYILSKTIPLTRFVIIHLFFFIFMLWID